MSEPIAIHRSSGNVFADLGIETPTSISRSPSLPRESGRHRGPGARPGAGGGLARDLAAQGERLAQGMPRRLLHRQAFPLPHAVGQRRHNPRVHAPSPEIRPRVRDAGEGDRPAGNPKPRRKAVCTTGDTPDLPWSNANAAPRVARVEGRAAGRSLGQSLGQRYGCRIRTPNRSRNGDAASFRF